MKGTITKISFTSDSVRMSITTSDGVTVAELQRLVRIDQGDSLEWESGEPSSFRNHTKGTDLPVSRIIGEGISPDDDERFLLA